jgi:glutathione reductase (NADPH)
MELLLKLTVSEEGGAAAVEKEKLDRQWYEEHHDREVLIEEGSDRILGAHIVGPHAEEQINIFALAFQSGITSEDLKEMIFAYPNGSSDISYML